MDIVVIMDGPETVIPETDTTYALILAAEEREHRTWHCQAGDIELNGGRVWARARRAMADEGATLPLRLDSPERLDLATVDAVLIRTDPPFDSPTSISPCFSTTWSTTRWWSTPPAVFGMRTKNSTSAGFPRSRPR